MPARRFIGSVVLAVLSLAACVAVLANDSAGALRDSKHVSRVVVPALAVRSARTAHPDASPHRSGDRAWGAEIVTGSPARGRIPTRAVRSVDVLPGHWASRHLII